MGLCKQLKLIAAFPTVSEATKSTFEEPCDLYFLDINLPGVSGLDFAKQVSDKSLVVFTTAYSEFAIDGFNLNAVDYLLKPIEFKRFEMAIKKVEDQLSIRNETDNFIFLKQSREIIKCNLKDVYYLKGMQEYIYWKTTTGKIISLGSLTKYTNDLHPFDFVRIHKSYVVNLKHVESMSTKNLIINSEELPIGPKYLKQVHELFRKKHS